MNDDMQDEGYKRVEVALKAVVIVSALGFFVMVADRAHVATAEPHPLAVAPIAAYQAVAEPMRGERPAASASASVPAAGYESNPALTGLYPDMNPSAASDENGHPPSF